MKQKIDVEFYTNWVAKFMDVNSIHGYHIYGYTNAKSLIELNKEIRKYLDKNLNMLVHSKKKQERIKFEWSKKKLGFSNKK